MDFITIPIGYILKFFSNICGNSYILAILLFAILTELIMALVFGIRQQKNSIKQARLRPKEAAIRKKYAGRDDKPTQQKMTQEIQELYQKEGYNPMGGCLPLLIQFPILIALYNIVIDPLKYICGLSQDAVAQVANIIGMDASNRRNMLRMLGGDPAGKIRKLMDYTPRGGDMADPWYSERFDIAYRDIYEGCEALLKELV